MKKLLITLSTALAVFSVSASENTTYTINLPVTSYHLSHSNMPGTTKPYNNKNYGLGFGVRTLNPENNFDYGIQVGQYDNSYYRTSRFVAFDAGYNFNETFRLGLIAGLITGYKGNQMFGNAGPLIAPQLDIKYDQNFKTTLTYLPTTIPKGSSAIAVSVGYTF